ncbi:thioesterase family protein [Streptomonospora sp. S1-112]|uniref:Thioesterase family protein n=1 Tax=Streptomonospora mangrovi TaxID=2883123 RepID=A0A9X3SJL4_9ACTN|nr:thioesterase family protein [Streptomonospora mangrovi]MDA0567479.1 thioesterase family protein [Streptomonospora mangrovi]
MTRFDTATAVTPTAEGRYAADLDPGYLIGKAMNGGYLMAVMQRAALAASTHPHAVSSSFHFLRPAGPGPAEVRATVLKSGRTVTTVRLDLRQGDTLAVTGTVATGTMDGAAQPEYAVAPPAVPPLAECRRYDPRIAARAAAEGEPTAEQYAQATKDVADFTGRVAQYYSEDSWRRLRGADPEPVPELLGHVHLAEDDGDLVPADPALLLPLAVDALPPVVTVFGTWRWAPTVELTWHMRAVPAPGPLVFRSRADAVSDGWFDETVDLWDVKGRLVAQSRQLARGGR